MNQIVHIFKKDLRRLWPEILVLFCLIILHAIFDIHSSPQGVQPESRFNTPASVLDLVLPLCIWIVVALLVFQESPVGDKQFWITRPYDWRKLLSAKILFLLVIVNATMLISDCCILAAHDLPVATVIPQLLQRQFQITLAFLVPALAIAVVSANMAQFVTFGVGAVLALVTSSILFTWLISPKGQSQGIVITKADFLWIAVFLLALAVFQYAARATSKARLALLIVLILDAPITFYFPFRVDRQRLEIASRNDPPAAHVRIEYDSSEHSRILTAEGNPPSSILWIKFPLEVTGLPADSLLRGHGMTKFLRNGKPLAVNRNSEYAAEIEFSGKQYIQSQAMDRSYLKLNSQPINLETSLTLELVNDKPNVSMTLTGGDFTVSGVGRCRTYQNREFTQVACRSGLEATIETSLRFGPHSAPGSSQGTFGHSEVPWGLSPVYDAGQTAPVILPPGAILEFIPRNKLASFHRTLGLPNFDPSHYLTPVDRQQEN